MEDQYEMMSQAKASTSELCAKSQQVAQAYLDDGNQEKYEEWHQRNADDCFLARMLRSIPGEG